MSVCEVSAPEASERPPELDSEAPPAVRVWGLPLAPWTLEQTLDEVERLVARRQPSYFVTANLNYAMLSHRDPSLREVNEAAAFVLADGMPLVWASRWAGTPLPERVAGSDLIFKVSERAADRGFRVFFLGGGEGVAERAAANLRERYPGLLVCGTHAPPFRRLSDDEHRGLIELVRDARPDILIGAFGQPHGERWMFENHRDLGVPVCVQLGASIDFAAGRVRRAPRVLQKTGLEWAYRFSLEPRRLGKRYWDNGLFFLGRAARELPRSLASRRARPAGG